MKRILLSLILLSAIVAKAETFVEQHGRLQVSGSQIVDKNGQAVPLRGMSMFWSQWSAQFYNGSTVDWLVKDWKVNLVRAAMGVDGNKTGYMVNAAVEKARVDTIVAGAVRNGIYVIIDWHDHDANQRTNESKAFFGEMAAKYKDLPNVIWEIWNEPLDTVSWVDDIKPYAEAVIPEIRKHDPDNLIIVGTRTWSQRVDEVIGHTIQDPNVAYTLHFYVGSHGTWLRGIADQAMTAGIPIFVTEWGIWDQGYVQGDYSKDVDLVQVMEWMDWMELHKLSSAMWSVNDKDEPSAVLLFGASATGNWIDADLTTAGKFIRSYIRGKDDGTWVTPVIPVQPIDTIALPGRLEAEKYADQQGIQVQKTEDAEGDRNIGYIENGDYTQYVVNVTAAGSHAIAVRYASGGVGGSLKISVDGVEKATVDIPVTGDWQSWATADAKIELTAGLHTMKFDFVGAATEALFNLNYVDFVNATSTLKGSRLRWLPSLSTQRVHYDLIGRRTSPMAW